MQNPETKLSTPKWNLKSPGLNRLLGLWIFSSWRCTVELKPTDADLTNIAIWDVEIPTKNEF